MDRQELVPNYLWDRARRTGTIDAGSQGRQSDGGRKQ